MRNLEEWTRYLEEQEQALQRKSRPAPVEPAMPISETRHAAANAFRPTVSEQPTDQLPDVAPKPEVREQARDTEAIAVKSAIHMRKNLPQQLLISEGGQTEITQNSYKGFKESREDFLRRLLDPQLTLEEAARVLNVCPTTVRRYTNKGLLQHFRTPGNQRRFRLSEVLLFLESSIDADSSE